MVHQNASNKLSALRASLAAHKSVAVAFSGGVDSSLLLFVAHEVLGERAVAVTARSCLFPQHELQETQTFCHSHGIRQVILDYEALEVPGLAENTPTRCYICKRALFEKMLAAAAGENLSVVIEGSNVDDVGDYRPGLKAIAELGIASPLRDAGFTKEDIRAVSQALGLSTWNKPSRACLASRLPFGTPLTPNMLSRIDAAEAWLLARGLEQVRVRVHGELARIACSEADMPLFASRAFQQETNTALKALGFTFVSLDLGGFVSGSLNTI